MKKKKTILPSPREVFPEDEDLPEGWKSIVLEDNVYIAARIGWRGLKREEYTKEGPLFLAVKDIQENGFIDFLNVTDHLSEYRYDESPEIQLKEEDIIITKDGTIGKIGFVKNLPGKVTVNSSLLVVRPSPDIQPRFLFFYFRSPSFQKIVQERITGSAVPHLFQKDIKKFRILMPPLPEQQRIVARIGALLSHVNEARGRLQRVPGIMKKFRQGVLAAACEGRLMGTPDGYESRPAGDFFIDARYGTSNKCDYTKEKKIPVLRIPNIATEKLELTDLKYGVLSDKEIQKLAVQEGDLIICRTNGSLDLVGKAAIIPKLSNQFVFASYLIRVRLNRDLLLPEYYHICLTSQVGRDHIEEMARSTAGQFNLNLEILRSMSVPLPPLAEQHEIVRRVNALFARADAIELEVADATKRADALTQAVLGKAFAGKL
jgi:type I restriction enzyme S subunit